MTWSRWSGTGGRTFGGEEQLDEGGQSRRLLPLIFGRERLALCRQTGTRACLAKQG